MTPTHNHEIVADMIELARLADIKSGGLLISHALSRSVGSAEIAAFNVVFPHVTVTKVKR